MAWSKSTQNDLGGYKEETITLPSSATIGYSSAIEFLKPRCDGTNQYVTIVAVASAVSGTNVDISLYGAQTSVGTKYLLVDAPGSIADITNAAKAASGVINLNAYPAPYYFIGMTADANESANSMSLYIHGDID